jgi:hypothetical protein
LIVELPVAGMEMSALAICVSVKVRLREMSENHASNV